MILLFFTLFAWEAEFFSKEILRIFWIAVIGNLSYCCLSFFFPQMSLNNLLQIFN